MSQELQKRLESLESNFHALDQSLSNCRKMANEQNRERAKEISVLQEKVRMIEGEIGKPSKPIN